jgi:hypothetical protein
MDVIEIAKNMGKKVFDFMTSFVSAEYIVNWLPNGGTAILVRTMICTLLIFLLSIGIYDYLNPCSRFAFDKSEFSWIVADKFEWIGAIFVAIYIALYTRYSAQWSYLANLYNQIMLAKSQQIRPEAKKYKTVNYSKDTPLRSLNLTEQAFARWQAGFIADAFELHLAHKDMFKSVIIGMLDLPGVQEAFLDAGGSNTELLKRFQSSI